MAAFEEAEPDLDTLSEGRIEASSLTNENDDPEREHGDSGTSKSLGFDLVAWSKVFPLIGPAGRVSESDEVGFKGLSGAPPVFDDMVADLNINPGPNGGFLAVGDRLYPIGLVGVCGDVATLDGAVLIEGGWRGLLAAPDDISESLSAFR